MALFRVLDVGGAGLGQHVGPGDRGAPAVLVRLLVVDEQLAVLAVAARLVARDLDDGEDGVALVEDGVHFLERAVGGFGVEEVDDRVDGSVTGGKKGLA